MESNKLIEDSAGRSGQPLRRVAYHNGCWVSGDDVALSPMDPAVTQGVTAVERVRVYSGRPFQLQLHLDRWTRTTEALFITGLPDRKSLSDLIEEVIDRNGKWMARNVACGVLMFASPGQGASPTLVVDLYGIDPILVRQRTEFGSPLVITSIQQPSNACWPRNIKVRCRLHYYLADHQAHQIDSNAIGVLIDTDGTVTESAIANIVAVQHGQLITPERDQVLQGVSLQVVREMAAEMGLDWCETRVSQERLRAADEILLTGTSCGIWFANSIDGTSVRTAGPIYRKLRRGFDELMVR